MNDAQYDVKSFYELTADIVCREIERARQARNELQDALSAGAFPGQPPVIRPPQPIQRAHYTIFFEEWKYPQLKIKAGNQYSIFLPHYEQHDYCLSIVRGLGTPRRITRFLHDVRGLADWYRARRDGLTRAAQAILQQQAAEVEALLAEGAMLRLQKEP